MSIQKLSDDSSFRKEKIPFSQISNKVIEHIKDNDAFRIYSFLCSKDRTWKVVKEWTEKQCGIGKVKAKQCWSYLARCNLIQYIEIRDSQGRIIKHDIEVLAGLQFKTEEPFLNKKQNVKTTSMKTIPLGNHHRYEKPPGGKTTRMENNLLLNKDITNKDKRKKQRESLSVPSDNFYPNIENQRLISERGLDVDYLTKKFILKAKSKGWKYVDVQAGFGAFILEERKIDKKEWFNPVEYTFNALQENLNRKNMTNLPIF